MKTKSVDVPYKGLTFTVKGEWGEGCSGGPYEPPKPPGFDGYDILLGSITVYELLNEQTVNEIVRLAEEQIGNG